MDHSDIQKTHMDSIRVMVVEPGMFFHDILKNYLAQLGCQVIACKDPGEALDDFDQNQVDLLLTGLCLDGMSGQELAVEIRKLELGRGQHTPIIGLTASDSEEVARLSYMAGFNDLINRNTGPKLFSEAVSLWVRRCLGLEETPSLRVLLAEDSPMVNKMLTMLLNKLGQEVNTCEDGFSALDIFKEKEIDLVFTDLVMPGIGGEELTMAIREYEGGQVHTPIIAITAADLGRKAETMWKAGIDASMPKNASARQLRDALVKWAPRARISPDRDFS